MTSMQTPRMKESIAVLGAASRHTENQLIAGFRVGREIALQGFNLATGMTLGVPYAAAIGAKSADGVVLGISPAESRSEHLARYGRPVDYIDIAVYTGMGLEGRQPILVRSAAAAIFIGGEFGTLAEFSAAWTSGISVLGVLEGMGGISDFLSKIVAQTQSNYGSIVIYDKHPESLVQKVCLELAARSNLSQEVEHSKGFGALVRATIQAYLLSHPDIAGMESTR